jgi:hypothetical protein
MTTTTSFAAAPVAENASRGASATAEPSAEACRNVLLEKFMVGS